MLVFSPLLPVFSPLRAERTISGVCFLAIVVGGLLIHPYLYAVLLVFMMVTMMNEEGAVRDITVTLEPDGDFLVAGTTCFRDERTGETVRGRATHRYHCVSTKEKKK